MTAPADNPVPARTPAEKSLKSIPIDPKKRNIIIIAAACALVAVIALAIIIPNALTNNDAKKDPDSNYSSSDEASVPEDISLPSSLTDTPSTDIPSTSSTSSENEPTSENKPTMVENILYDGKLVYSGEWENGMPNGAGMVRRYDDASFLEVGTYENGKISVGGRIIIGDKYTSFGYGKYNNGRFSEGYSEWNNIYELGTFNSGVLVEGEKLLFYDDDHEAIIFVGSFSNSGLDRKFCDGYQMQFDTYSGELVSCIKLTNGEEQEISVDQAKEISELKKYNAQYISDVTSNHYGYDEYYNDLMEQLNSMPAQVSVNPWPST